MYKLILNSKLDDSIRNKNSQYFWSLIKYTPSSPSYISPNEWFLHFSRLFSELDQQTPIPVIHSYNPPQNENVLDCNITDSEVVNVIKGLKNNKACGIDGVQAECWKHTRSINVVNTLCTMFNCFYDNAFFPKLWKTAIIIPVYKMDASTILGIVEEFR